MYHVGIGGEVFHKNYVGYCTVDYSVGFFRHPTECRLNLMLFH